MAIALITFVSITLYISNERGFWSYLGSHIMTEVEVSLEIWHFRVYDEDEEGSALRTE